MCKIIHEKLIIKIKKKKISEKDPGKKALRKRPIQRV